MDRAGGDEDNGGDADSEGDEVEEEVVEGDGDDDEVDDDAHALSSPASCRVEWHGCIICSLFIVCCATSVAIVGLGAEWSGNGEWNGDPIPIRHDLDT